MNRRTLILAVPTALAAATDGKPNVDILRVDVRTRDVSGTQWSTPTILPGSLVKPFTALAYGATHGDRFPTLRCDGCWGGRAHGEVDLVKAIALSCNRYFESLSVQIEHQQMLLTAGEYALTPPPDSVEARYGLGRQWRMSPQVLINAYLQITHPAILEGLRRCASVGTAKAVAAGSLAKTGTAPCEHTKRMPGDGLAIALWPADQPRQAILVREHGVPGAVAAKRLRGLLIA